MQLSFLGATGTVTGSKYLLSHGHRQILIDCGLFQGLKNLRQRNWTPFPYAPENIHATVLTHAHLDHSGYLPRLAHLGFSGSIYSTKATHDLCDILLPDSAMIMEEEAGHANKHGYSKHNPSLPLYTVDEAKAVSSQFQNIPWDKNISLGSGLTLRLLTAGHILGASIAIISDGNKTIVFSGDLGRSDDPILPPPADLPDCDYLVVESTYGDRIHEPLDPGDQLADAINTTLKRNGTVIIPSFAVGRSQLLLYQLSELLRQGKIPHIPIYIDSPMAHNVTDLYCRHIQDHKLSKSACHDIFGIAHYVTSPQESYNIGNDGKPKVLISASGMATGGRVLHHIKALGGDARNMILFSGYQAAGTRGAALLGGATSLKIHGSYVEIFAEVRQLKNFSAHADSKGIINWLKTGKKKPIKTFITHGEPTAADTLRRNIHDTLGWDCEVPEYLQKVDL